MCGGGGGGTRCGSFGVLADLDFWSAILHLLFQETACVDLYEFEIYYLCDHNYIRVKLPIL